MRSIFGAICLAGASAHPLSQAVSLSRPYHPILIMALLAGPVHGVDVQGRDAELHAASASAPAGHSARREIVPSKFDTMLARAKDIMMGSKFDPLANQLAKQMISDTPLSFAEAEVGLQFHSPLQPYYEFYKNLGTTIRSGVNKKWSGRLITAGEQQRFYQEQILLSEQKREELKSKYLIHPAEIGFRDQLVSFATAVSQLYRQATVTRSGGNLLDSMGNSKFNEQANLIDAAWAKASVSPPPRQQPDEYEQQPLQRGYQPPAQQNPYEQRTNYANRARGARAQATYAHRQALNFHQIENPSERQTRQYHKNTQRREAAQAEAEHYTQLAAEAAAQTASRVRPPPAAAPSNEFNIFGWTPPKLPFVT